MNYASDFGGNLIVPQGLACSTAHVAPCSGAFLKHAHQYSATEAALVRVLKSQTSNSGKTLMSIDETLQKARDRAKQMGLPYEGALTPREAFELMQQVPAAKLVDV